MIIAVVGQKGGTGKSTLARLLAVELCNNGLKTLLADTDHQQQTSLKWMQRRTAAGWLPTLEAQVFRVTSLLAKRLADYEAVVVDGSPHATEATFWLAKHANLIIIPSGMSLDDLEPSVQLGLEFLAAGIPTTRLCYALTRTTPSPTELESTRVSIQQSGFCVADSTLPMSTAYAQAQDLGRTVAETRFPSLNERADVLVQSLFDYLKAEFTTHGET